MDPETIKDLIDLLIEIGGSLAEAGFELALRRTSYLGFTNTLVGILLFVGFFFATKYAIYFIKKTMTQDTWDMNEIPALILSLSAIALFIAGLAMLIDGFDYLINSEWNAVQMLLGILP